MEISELELDATYLSVAFWSLVAIFGLLMISHGLWKTKRLNPEVSRKIVHVSTGTFIAFWPFFMSFEIIQILSLLMLLVVLLSRRFNIFPAITSVRRSTIGDALFPIGFGLLALLTDSPWIFMAAMLHVSLADGFAAIIGVSFGSKHKYKVFGHTKTWLGTSAFVITSVAILTLTIIEGNLALASSGLFWLLPLPFLLALAENASPYGADNVTVPLLVWLAFSYGPILA